MNINPDQNAVPSASTPGSTTPAAAAPSPAAPVSDTGFKPTITIDDFVKIDLRVATVLDAQPHPKADRLLKLQLDLGIEKRQVCAGIRAYYPDPSVLIGKQVIVVANLAPRMLRGEPSNGMILAASAAEGDNVTNVVVLSPSQPVPPGSKVG